MAAKARSVAEKWGSRVLRETEAIPRLRRARQSRALIDAIQRQDGEQLAVWLLRHGFDPNASDNKGRSALWWASAWGRSEVIEQLVRRGAALPDDVLIGPVFRGDQRIVRLLVQRGANVNCVGTPYSPVGHHNLFRQPLLAMAIAQAAGPFGRNESIPIILVRAGATVDRLILEHGPWPGAENRSMLGLAANFGLLKTVRAMIAAGADVNIRDSRGRTPLMDALDAGHAAVVNALRKAGAHVDSIQVTPASTGAASTGRAGNSPRSPRAR